MNRIISDISAANWEVVASDMHEKGFAVIPGLLSEEQCDQIKGYYQRVGIFRKSVVMERYRFGMGEYKYFNYPLPEVIQSLRYSLYPHLVPVANLWMKVLNIGRTFPETHQELIQQCHLHGQDKATVLVLKYEKGGYNTLHQDLYGEIYFPIQAVVFLDEPGEDFTGGEFVMTHQIPRAQSKAVVLNPGKGDILCFTTNFRPVKGAKGYYRVNVKHGVSEVLSGQRHALGIIFHDAVN